MIASPDSSEAHSEDVGSSPGEPGSNFLERRIVLYPAVGVIVALGLAFRAIQYAADRSLWLDESMLALNLLHRSAAGLTRTLDYAQAAPLGFLELEKLATHAFGDSELALRVLPLICGLASVPLFAALALRLLRPAPALLATLVFACAAGPVYYASEVKQYSGDLAVAIGLTLLAVLFLDGALSGWAQVVASLAGAAAMFLSHASVFVAGGIALALAANACLRRDRKAFEALAAIIPWLFTSVFIVVFTRARTTALDTVIGPELGTLTGMGRVSSRRLNWIRDVTSALLRSIGYPAGGAGAIPPLAAPRTGGFGSGRPCTPSCPMGSFPAPAVRAHLARVRPGQVSGLRSHGPLSRTRDGSLPRGGRRCSRQGGTVAHSARLRRGDPRGGRISSCLSFTHPSAQCIRCSTRR